MVGVTTRALLAPCLAILVMISCEVCAEELTLEGLVRGTDGNPKVSARVHLVRSGDRKQYIAVTNQEGRFAIESLSTGRYLVRIRQGNEIQEFVRRIESKEDEFVVSW